MALDAKLLAILVCPKDKGPLYYFPDEDSLYNPRLKLRYRISDDIPVMLIDEADSVSDEEAARLEAKAAAEASQPTGHPPAASPASPPSSSSPSPSSPSPSSPSPS